MVSGCIDVAHREGHCHGRGCVTTLRDPERVAGHGLLWEDAGRGYPAVGAQC